MGLIRVGRGAWRLSGCQTHGKPQDIPEEQGPPAHRAFQPWWIVQARSSQSWPSQPRAPPRGSSRPHGEHYLSPLLLAQAGTRALQARGREGPGLQDSLGPAGLAQAQCGGRGSPADRAFWACSAALAMWEVMLSQPHTLEKVLRELLSKRQDQQLRGMFSATAEEACIYHLAVSDQTSPRSPSGLCLPLQANRHGPLPSHPPPNGHLLRTYGHSPLGPAGTCPAPGSPPAPASPCCPQDGLSGPGGLALSCQWEPGAARCGEPCRLCQSLTAIFFSAAGLQQHYIREVCWPVQSPQVPAASKPGAALAGAQRPRHAVAET